MKVTSPKNINQKLKDDHFISIINLVIDSIKEYYKVTINTNKNEKILVDSIKNETNNFELLFSKNINNSLQIKEYKEKKKELFDNLEININSHENNLCSFFEDAKKLFKEMKNQYHEFLSRSKNTRTTSNKIINKGINNMINKKSHFPNCNSEIQRICTISNEKTNPFQNSAIYLLNNMNIDNNDSEINKLLLNNKSNNNNNGRNLKYKKIINSANGSNRARTICKTNENNSKKTDIERLKAIIKKYELHIKKLTNELKRYKPINNQNMDNINNKSLRGSKYDSHNKTQSLSDYKNTTKRYFSPILNQKDINDRNADFINRINILTKENNILKKKLNSFKQYSLSPHSDFNCKIPLKSLELGNIQFLEMEIEKMTKKVNSIEKKLFEEQNKNKELLNENNKYKLEISRLTKKYSELSTKLLNKQNELLNYQKENIEKNIELKELKELKLSTNNSKSNITNSNLILENGKNDTPDNSKIFENYKNENDELIKKSNVYQDKIKYYQKQIKNIKNELYEKIQANIEQQNNSEKQLNEMKNDYEKRIEDINNKYKCIEKNLAECQNFNNELNQQINDLNQQIISKDINILELNYQVEQIQKQLTTREEENKKLSEELNKKLSDGNNNTENQHIKLLQEQLKEQKNINNNLNDELSKVKKENVSFNQKIQKEKNQDIDNIKKENIILKENNEKLTKELKDILDNNKYNGNFEEVNLEIERKNEEIKILKRENEKIKEQLIRLSKTLPEENNELFKKYRNLEIKYKKLLKNNGIDELKEEDNKELNKFKEEIEEIKKKNMELVRQLEDKEINNKDCYDNKSEQNISNYEEEFDLRKMAKGAKNKNRSQDINIDYPGIQQIKEKYRELDFYYNSLEELVKKLLLTVRCDAKNKVYISELCKIVGFDQDITNKILTNKNKNFILGLFNK